MNLINIILAGLLVLAFLASGARTGAKDHSSPALPGQITETSEAPVSPGGQDIPSPETGAAEGETDAPSMAAGYSEARAMSEALMERRREAYAEACRAITYQLQEEYPLYLGWRWINRNTGRLFSEGCAFAGIRVRQMDGVEDERFVRFEKGAFRQLVPLAEPEEVEYLERKRQEEAMAAEEERRQQEEVDREETLEVLPDEPPATGEGPGTEEEDHSPAPDEGKVPEGAGDTPAPANPPMEDTEQDEDIPEEVFQEGEEAEEAHEAEGAEETPAARSGRDASGPPMDGTDEGEYVPEDFFSDGEDGFLDDDPFQFDQAGNGAAERLPEPPMDDTGSRIG